MKLRKDQVKKMYRDAIIQVFGCDDKEISKDLIKAVNRDIHYGDTAPGEWDPSSILEIYCENGIPNATDIHDLSAYAREFGFDPKTAVSYNSESWEQIDGLVNLLLEALNKSERYYHQPYNNAVVNIYRR